MAKRHVPRLPRQEVKQYTRETPFTAGEVQRLWKRFNAMDNDGNGYLAIQEMLKVEELSCNPFARRIVELFSETGSGELDFQHYINLMSVFSPRASAEAKMVWAFALWDFDGDDLVGPQDIKKGLHMLTNAGVLTADDDINLEAAEEGHGGGWGSDAKKYRRSEEEDLLTLDHMEQILVRLADEIDPDGSGLTFTDFESIASRMPDFVTNFRMSM